MKKTTKQQQGFTLVELIVVITILAILGTIGFISLQGYSAQSRDSKRTSDLRSLATAVTTKSTEGISLLSFVTGTSSNVTTANIAGTGSSATDYAAGTPNATVLGVNAANFNDPNTVAPYKIGASTRLGGVFQVAARLESGNLPTASVTGNYNARTATSFTLSTAAVSGASQLNVPVTAVGLFKKGDQVVYSNGTNTGTTTLSSVSGDGRLLNLTAVTGNTATTVILGNVTLGLSEVAGLIGKTGALGTPVTDKSTADLPY